MDYNTPPIVEIGELIGRKRNASRDINQNKIYIPLGDVQRVAILGELLVLNGLG